MTATEVKTLKILAVCDEVDMRLYGNGHGVSSLLKASSPRRYSDSIRT